MSRRNAMKTDGARAGVSEPDVRAAGEYALRAEFFISPCLVQSLLFYQNYHNIISVEKKAICTNKFFLIFFVPVE